MEPAALNAAMRPVLDALQVQELWTFPVEHCRKSYGLVVEGLAGWKFVFSGDTRPCDAVVDAAKGATLLVHEATFEDALKEDAETKRHSTVSEAVATGEKVAVFLIECGVSIIHAHRRGASVPSSRISARGIPRSLCSSSP